MSRQSLRQESERRVDPPRIRRERRTVSSMIRIFCRGKHASRDGLCESCQEVLSYAQWRLERCPFQENKPTCSHCAIHCYRPEIRERIKKIMRYAGPRMVFRHPWLSLRHLLDGLAGQPELPRRRSCPEDAT